MIVQPEFAQSSFKAVRSEKGASNETEAGSTDSPFEEMLSHCCAQKKEARSEIDEPKVPSLAAVHGNEPKAPIREADEGNGKTRDLVVAATDGEPVSVDSKETRSGAGGESAGLGPEINGMIYAKSYDMPTQTATLPIPLQAITTALKGPFGLIGRALSAVSTGISLATETAVVTAADGSSAKSAARVSTEVAATTANGERLSEISASLTRAQSEAKSKNPQTIQERDLAAAEKKVLKEAVKLPRASGNSSKSAPQQSRAPSARAVAMAQADSMPLAAPTPQSVVLPMANPAPGLLNPGQVEPIQTRSASLAGQANSGNFGNSGSESDRGRGDGNTSSNILGMTHSRLDAAAAQKAENVRVFVSQVDSALQTMRLEKNTSVQLRVSLERGEVIRIHLSLRGSKLRTIIQTDSDSARQQLRDSWTEVSRALAEKGVEAETPDFGNNSEHGSGEDRSFEERVEAEFAQAGADAPLSDSTQNQSVMATEPRESRYFSRIA